MMKKDGPAVPLGLGYALAENNEALKYFAALSSENQREIIEQTRKIGSKAEMRQFVENLVNRENPTL